MATAIGVESYQSEKGFVCDGCRRSFPAGVIVYDSCYREFAIHFSWAACRTCYGGYRTMMALNPELAHEKPQPAFLEWLLDHFGTIEAADNAFDTESRDVTPRINERIGVRICQDSKAAPGERSWYLETEKGYRGARRHFERSAHMLLSEGWEFLSPLPSGPK